jgi:hypothetical protein
MENVKFRSYLTASNEKNLIQTGNKSFVLSKTNKLRAAANLDDLFNEFDNNEVWTINVKKWEVHPTKDDSFYEYDFGNNYSKYKNILSISNNYVEINNK